MEARAQLPPHRPSHVVVAVPSSAVADESSLVRNEASPDARSREAWLPITESRDGSAVTAAFHVLCSGIGIQALMLPVAFASLGWLWGTICLSLLYAWQLHTKWLLVQLHEGSDGTRYSRFLHLSITAFGPRLGKLLAIFPVMYLSGGTCAMMIIIGGGTIQLLFDTLRDGDHARSPSGVLWFLAFVFVAIAIAILFPNLNSLAGASLVGAVAAICYAGLIVGLSIGFGRPDSVSYVPLDGVESRSERASRVLNAIGTVALVFRGSNLILEIQGTLPSDSKHQSRKSMWRATSCSYILIGTCYSFVAIGGFWSYGNQIKSGGLLSSFPQFHPQRSLKHVLVLIYALIIINCLCTFQIFAMPVFDNLEMSYVSVKNHQCSRSTRTVIRLLFGCLVFFISAAFPFLQKLGPLIGGLASALTYAYPCFMWLALKGPHKRNWMWWLNLGLGSSAVVLWVVMVVAAAWNLVEHGLQANFFNP
ncbi:hypothetical protein MLD38_023008 [Melastoma candidum]|uniref:Uncharacterized protein n=1 Tax=Melastoma candidum TaxID=119954 RepID=A0ACB9QL64_9MYRT|nr:hypothetical protein MLD38_023008 [Melastoma candidum]